MIAIVNGDCWYKCGCNSRKSKTQTASQTETLSTAEKLEILYNN